MKKMSVMEARSHGVEFLKSVADVQSEIGVVFGRFVVYSLHYECAKLGQYNPLSSSHCQRCQRMCYTVCSVTHHIQDIDKGTAKSGLILTETDIQDGKVFGSAWMIHT